MTPTDFLNHAHARQRCRVAGYRAALMAAERKLRHRNQRRDNIGLAAIETTPLIDGLRARLGELVTRVDGPLFGGMCLPAPPAKARRAKRASAATSETLFGWSV